MDTHTIGYYDVVASRPLTLWERIDHAILNYELDNPDVVFPKSVTVKLGQAEWAELEALKPTLPRAVVSPEQIQRLQQEFVNVEVHGTHFIESDEPSLIEIVPNN